MEKILTIETVDEAVFRALRWLNPSEFRFKREQVGTTIGYEIEDTSGVVLGRYNIRPGREATVDHRMNWFSENLVARESCLKLIELELQALESSQEANSVGESTTNAEIRQVERIATNEDHLRAMEALEHVREARLIEQLEIISPESASRQPPTLEQFAIWIQEFSATQAQKVQNAYYLPSGSYGPDGSFQVDAVEPIPLPYVVSFSNEHLVVVTFGGEFYRCACYGELRVTMLPNGRLQYRVTGPKTDWENLSRSWKRLYTEMQRHGWVESDEGQMRTEQLAGPAAVTGQSASETDEGQVAIPKRPEKQKPIDKWFDYYHQCKQSRIKYTLEDLASDVNLTYGYVRQKHSEYLAEHRGDRTEN